MKRGKNAQLNLSFGMIFSIILIIAFIGAAFFAIQKFLEMQDAAKVGQFKNNLQNDVDKMWKSFQGSQKVEYSLPNQIEKVCFEDDPYENIFFNSKEFFQRYNINHIDIEKITENENPFCINNKDGKIKMILKKDYGDNLVKIEE